MTKLRHLTWMLMAAAGLLLSAGAGHAQSNDPGDQPASSRRQLPTRSGWQKQMVLYRTTEPPGTIIVSTSERHLYLVQPGAARYATASVSAATASSGRASSASPTRRNGRTGHLRRR